MNDKPIRKNKTNLVVNWPATDQSFTINELAALNDNFIQITLRVRVQKAIEENRVVAIGTKNLKKGRPQLVFALRPVSQAALEHAKASGAILDDQSRLITVMEVPASMTTITVNETVKATAVA